MHINVKHIKGVRHCQQRNGNMKPMAIVSTSGTWDSKPIEVNGRMGSEYCTLNQFIDGKTYVTVKYKRKNNIYINIFEKWFTTQFQQEIKKRLEIDEYIWARINQNTSYFGKNFKDLVSPINKSLHEIMDIAISDNYIVDKNTGNITTLIDNITKYMGRAFSCCEKKTLGYLHHGKTSHFDKDDIELTHITKIDMNVKYNPCELCIPVINFSDIPSHVLEVHYLKKITKISQLVEAIKF